jgi:hypothetical protein
MGPLSDPIPPCEYDEGVYNQHGIGPFDIDDTVRIVDMKYPSFLFILGMLCGLFIPCVLLLYKCLPPPPTDNYDFYTMLIVKELKLDGDEIKNSLPIPVINFEKEKRTFPVPLTPDE